MNTAKISAKDFFLYLGATAALYVSATALINLSFTVINYYFPDALAGYFYGNAVAWPISMLVVLVPILYALEWMIGRDIVRMPEKKDLGIRTWRIYLVLFSAVVLIGGDLIALINTYLNGEITSRFVYKIIAIVLVAGTIGKYYFFSLYENFRWSRMMRRGHAWFGAILVVAAIVAGFVAVGSPAQQRGLRFDSQRTSDLQSIQWQIISYWQTKEKLPAALADLDDAVSGFKVPTDPETDAVYGYAVKVSTGAKGAPSGLSFELCAAFSQPSPDDKGRGAYYSRGGGIAYPMIDTSYPYPGGIDDNWTHEAGKACFERTIDPDKYPVNRPVLKGI